jgi:calcium-dependent protein kinase
MRLNNCSNVTHLHAVYQDAASVYLVQELCTGGDLQTLLDSQGILSEHEAAQAALGILTTLEQCHHLGICYGDVKPANFLVRDMYPSMAHIIDPSKPKGSLNLKTADFGCSQQCDDEDTPCLTKLSGTPIYIAPEVRT